MFREYLHEITNTTVEDNTFIANQLGVLFN